MIFPFEITKYFCEENDFDFGDYVRIGELVRGQNGILAIPVSTAEPDRYTAIEDHTIDYYAINSNTTKAYEDLQAVYDFFHQKEHYQTGGFVIYYSNVLTQIIDLDRDGENRKVLRTSIHFIIRKLELIS